MTTLNYYLPKQHSSNTVPYVYYVYCRPTREYYIGCRYAKGCHPGDLWETYYTSSKRIHKLIEDYGKDSFFYYCIRECVSREEALDLEEALIRHSFKKPKFLNICLRGKKFAGTLPGTPKSLEYRQNQSKRLKNKKVSQKWKDSHSKTWKVTTPQGKELIIHNLQEWCKVNSELKLYPQNLRDVAKGKYKQHKGYKCEYFSKIKELKQ